MFSKVTEDSILLWNLNWFITQISSSTPANEDYSRQENHKSV